MSLTSNKTGAAVENDVAVKAAPLPEVKIQLELAMYDRYSRGDKLFVKRDETTDRPVAYGFTQAQARILLQEVEEPSGRPIWRRPRPMRREEIQQKFVGQAMVLDASASTIKEIAADPDAIPAQRIDFGDDSELTDIPGLLDLSDHSSMFAETPV